MENSEMKYYQIYVKYVNGNEVEIEYFLWDVYDFLKCLKFEYYQIEEE